MAQKKITSGYGLDRDSGKKSESTLAKPDFAYPADVKQVAGEAYDEALKNGDGIKALLAAMEINVADQLISRTDSVGAVIARYEEIAGKFKAPYSSLAKLLEIEFLQEVYSRNRYMYNQRVLPLEPLSDEPSLWSGDQFKARIAALMKEVLTDENVLCETPINEISLLLTNSVGAEVEGMTAWDFVVMNMISVSGEMGFGNQDEVIPFRLLSQNDSNGVVGEEGSVGSNAEFNTRSSGDNSALIPINLIDRLIEADERAAEKDPRSAGALSIARLAKIDLLAGEKEKCQYAEKLLEEYPVGNKLRPRIVLELCNNGIFKDNEEYSLIDEILRNYPKCNEYACLEDLRNRLEMPYMELTSDSQWLTTGIAEIQYTFRNVRDLNLLLVPVSARFAESSNPKLRNVAPTGRIANILDFSCDKPFLFSEKDTLRINAKELNLKPGYYAVVPSSDNTIAGLPASFANYNPLIVNVSDLYLFTSMGIEESGKDGANYLYVTDARNNNPISGVKVTVKDEAYRSKNVPRKLVTDDQGRIELPFENWEATVEHKGNRLIWSSYTHNGRFSNTDRYTANIFPDLSIYHPGDSINCVAVVAKMVNNLLSPADSLKVKIMLFNANGKEVANKECVTDQSGRAMATLPIPSEGLTGDFRIQVMNVNDYLASKSVEVAEYKSPTFLVTLDKVETAAGKLSADASDADDATFKKGDVIRISGNVATYSGMPLQDTEVDIDINFMRFWFRYFNSDVDNLADEFSHTVMTDANGRFELLLATDGMLPLGYGAGVFTVEATATDAAGETQEASPVRFVLGSGYELMADIPDKIKVTGDSIALSVKVRDMMGGPARKSVEYKIDRLGNSDTESVPLTMAEGEFESPTLEIPASRLLSGEYKLTAVLKKSRLDYSENKNGEWVNDTISQKFVIWREDDVRPADNEPVWLPVTSVYAEVGSSETDFIVGSPYSGDMLYYEISDIRRILERGWLNPKGKNVSFKVESPSAGNLRKVTFSGVHDLSSMSRSIVIYPAEDKIRMEIKTETFRDKLTPGAEESWKFRLQLTDGILFTPAGFAAAVAVMSNASLEAIAPFQWSFTPQGILDRNTAGRLQQYSPGRDWFSGNLTQYKAGNAYCGLADVPDWNFWGYSIMGYNRRGVHNLMYKMAAGRLDSNAMDDADGAVYMESATTYMSAAPMASKAIADVEVSEDSEYESSAETGGALESNVQDAQDVQLRDVECPLAFFMPDLTADEDGVVSLDFKVPNFNTTWNLRLLGYDQHMKGVIGKYSAVASKPVMISINMPRFLLTGDKAEISATVFNNTDEPMDISAEMEVFEILSGRAVGRVEKNMKSLAPSASDVITLKFDVGYDYSQLAVRAIARSERGSDGEQTAVQVLPSSQPVREAYTIYLRPGNDSAEIILPSMKKGDSVTLNYCTNPSWYVLTALSGLLNPDSESALAISDAWFSNAIATHLLQNDPKLAEGLARMFETQDSALISPLMKNEGIKYLPLNSTPWVNNAENETQRMAGLRTLLDKENAAVVTSSLIKKLADLQQPDGGWSWMKLMPSSEFATEFVLQRMADLKRIGYLDECLAANPQLKTMIQKGMKYYDRKVAEDYREVTEKYKSLYPLSGEVRYFLLRNALTDAAPTGYLLKMQNDMRKRLPGGWKDFGIDGKTSAAIILSQEGDTTLARQVLESVKQYASFKKDKGMWFDNGDGEFFSPHPLTLAANALQAFAEVEPEDPAVSRLCQYLVLSRQTQDWSLRLCSGVAAHVVAAVMQGVPDWAGDTDSVSEITLDGVPVNVPQGEILTGGFYMNLDPEKASGRTLRISKNSNAPSWGGVLESHVAEVSKVKAHSVPQLRIEKTLLNVSADDSGKKTSGKTTSGKKTAAATTKFRKGDRIRVTLTIETDRDLDYLLISDGRSACMQPADQLTEYAPQDGLWMLRETRNFATNFYITSMPKGKHVISYEVFADRDGEYSCGIADAQSQYYPMISAHSAGYLLEIK